MADQDGSESRRHLPLIIAHRGSRTTAPENTLVSFEHALGEGADGIELDVQLSRDGIPLVFHDFKLNRLTACRGPVRRCTAAYLRSLDVGRHFHSGFAGTVMPTLTEVLDQFSQRTILNIELKLRWPDLKLVRGILRCLSENHSLEKILLSSFDPITLWILRRLDKRIAIGFLYTNRFGQSIATGNLGRLLLGDRCAHHPHHKLVTSKSVNRIQDAGLGVHVWTVNEKTEIRDMIALGVDMIITDHVRVAREVLTEKFGRKIVNS